MLNGGIISVEHGLHLTLSLRESGDEKSMVKEVLFTFYFKCEDIFQVRKHASATESCKVMEKYLLGSLSDLHLFGKRAWEKIVTAYSSNH